MHPRSYCARLGEVCSKCRSHLLVNNPRGGVRSLARNACKEPLVLVSKRKNNEKTSNSWNSFGSLGCIGISLFGHRYAEHEHSAGQTDGITDRNRTGSDSGRIARSYG